MLMAPNGETCSAGTPAASAAEARETVAPVGDIAVTDHSVISEAVNRSSSSSTVERSCGDGDVSSSTRIITT